jgi:sigma-54-specific transcriptional regulator
LLVDYFLSQAAQRTGRPVPTLEAAAWDKLRNYAWPGNIRELQHVVRRAVLICRGSQIAPGDLELAPGAGANHGQEKESATACVAKAVKAALASTDENIYESLHNMLDLELLRQVLAECNGNQVQTARRLGISRNGLRAKMEALGLE